MNNATIYADGLERFPVPAIITSNTLMLVWVLLGTYLSASFAPLAGLIYFATAFLMITVILRKLVCVNCWYYGKWCHTGWGKLSALMFKQGKVENFASCTGLKIVPFFYGLLSLIPVGLGIAALIINPDKNMANVAGLALLLTVSFSSGVLVRRKTCAKCKMKLICPGSAE